MAELDAQAELHGVPPLVVPDIQTRRDPDEELGKLAYAEYCSVVDAPTRAWEDLEESTRVAWIHAAIAVIEAKSFEIERKAQYGI